MIPRRFLRRLCGLAGIAHDDGLAAVEFALLAPIYLTVFAGMVDLGNILFTNYQLDMAVTAGTQYVMVNATSVGPTNGASLATSVAAIVANAVSTGWANDTIVVNNGPTVTTTAGVAASTGVAANAASCYCPTGTASSITWGTGSTANCGTSCSGSASGTYGQFVTITASRAYSPLIASYGLVHSGTITKSVIIQASISSQP